MKVVILAGGFGTRISEESQFKPKPMVELGERPIIWHIMKLYSTYGYNEFIICAGYRQHVIKEYFADYFLHTSDVTYDFTNGKNEIIIHCTNSEPWRVTVVDTGLNTMTGGRVKRIKKYIGDEPFMLTYGDGVADVNIAELLNFHQSHEKIVTISAYNAGQRFGVLDIDKDGQINEFREKTKGDGNMINIGFMICQPSFIDFIENDDTILEKAPLETVAKLGQLMAYKHEGFWQCMDTVREKEALEKLWASGQAPWKVWVD
ncbi:glucose-1-phosphate cytidylyltransferase [Butyricicoccus faecihominis]|uniref:glucose-1-phosphate cytidylyltransferase n=1 Tax=Butyricicoccus faecihominis TaxID=1712515 RepID=UPI00247A7CD5|nr:glucose-1-phosphate cytidylyltransferase [Butyricicoccus faecihominis]MCQ5128156.1 glucose-1-phosphate cytidylyltransferase [Butyricicoccus faecihominis]